MPTIVLLSALISPPAAKKQPAAMNPIQTRAKPPRGPSAMKAQMPPSTATLTDSASNSVMAFPHRFVLRESALELRSVLLFRQARPLFKLTRSAHRRIRKTLAAPSFICCGAQKPSCSQSTGVIDLCQRDMFRRYLANRSGSFSPDADNKDRQFSLRTRCHTSVAGDVISLGGDGDGEDQPTLCR